jgi:hypothetical protein
MNPILIVIIVLTLLWMGSTIWGLATDSLVNTFYLFYLARLFFVVDVIAILLYLIFHVRLSIV